MFFYLNPICCFIGLFAFTSAQNQTLFVQQDEAALPTYAIVAAEEDLGGSIDPSLAGTSFRIVGGYEAVPGMFPWLANENRECGATLIASEFLPSSLSLVLVHYLLQLERLSHYYLH